ncbi:MAG: acetylglutamate kinase [Gemmatimonadota bacterium]
MLTVVKIGGAWLESGPAIEPFQVLAALPGDLVVVHGGGKEISRWLDRVGVPVEWADGLRVTRGDGLQVTAMVLSGWVNKRVAEALDRAGRPALGISGEDGGLLDAIPLDPARLGEVGTVRSVNPTPVRVLLDGGFTPVVSPVSRGLEGRPLNVNADEAAIALARELRADRLLLVSDVPGVLADGELLGSLTEREAEDLAARGIIAGGMKVKVQQALSAAAAGVEVRIGDEGLLSGSPGTWIRSAAASSSSARA